MQILAWITHEPVIEAILDALDLPCQPPPLTPAARQLEFCFD